MKFNLPKEPMPAALAAIVVLLGAKEVTNSTVSLLSKIATRVNCGVPVARLFNEKYNEFTKSVKGFSQEDRQAVFDKINASKGKDDKKIEQVSQLSFRNKKHVEAVETVVKAIEGAEFEAKVKEAMPKQQASLTMEAVLAKLGEQGYLTQADIAGLATKDEVESKADKTIVDGYMKTDEFGTHNKSFLETESNRLKANARLYGQAYETLKNAHAKIVVEALIAENADKLEAGKEKIVEFPSPLKNGSKVTIKIEAGTQEADAKRQRELLVASPEWKEFQDSCKDALKNWQKAQKDAILYSGFCDALIEKK